jgi:hypothetical protein
MILRDVATLVMHVCRADQCQDIDIKVTVPSVVIDRRFCRK